MILVMILDISFFEIMKKIFILLIFILAPLQILFAEENLYQTATNLYKELAKSYYKFSNFERYTNIHKSVLLKYK